MGRAKRKRLNDICVLTKAGYSWYHYTRGTQWKTSMLMEIRTFMCENIHTQLARVSFI